VPPILSGISSAELQAVFRDWIERIQSGIDDSRFISSGFISGQSHSFLDTLDLSKTTRQASDLAQIEGRSEGQNDDSANGLGRKGIGMAGEVGSQDKDWRATPTRTLGRRGYHGVS
jgi:hypothetical protein